MAGSDLDSAYLRKLVLEESANLRDVSRGTLFQAGSPSIARSGGAENLETLVSLLRIDRTARLHRAVAEATDVSETSFFRDVKPFEALRRTVIPALMKQNQERRTLRIWSAACSTGQEAYSIAMVLLEHFPELAEWDVKIVGTDIAGPALEDAERGRYRRAEVNRGLPARALVKYFVRDEEEWEVSAPVKALCQFQYAKLDGVLPATPAFDLVMLRNVLLYFPQQDRSRVLSAVHGQMNPRGYLLLGNGEQAEDSTDQFVAEHATDCCFYRPVADEPTRA